MASTGSNLPNESTNNKRDANEADLSGRHEEEASTTLPNFGTDSKSNDRHHTRSAPKVNKKRRRNENAEDLPPSAVSGATPDETENDQSEESSPEHRPPRSDQQSTGSRLLPPPVDGNATSDVASEANASAAGSGLLINAGASASTNSTIGDLLATGASLVVKDTSDPMEKKVVDGLNAEDLAVISKKMYRRGFPDKTNWPTVTFSKVYLQYGVSEFVKKYARCALRALEAKRALLSVSDPNSVTNQLSSDEETQRNSRIRSHEHYDEEMLEVGEWNEMDPTMSKPPMDVGSIFKDLDEKAKKLLSEKIAGYNPLNPDVELRDWCTYYDSIRAYCSSLSVLKANFVLVNSVPPVYILYLMAGLKTQVLTMPNLILARRIGCVMYERNQVDPVALSAVLWKGRFKIANTADLLRRIVDMHYCTFPKVDKKVFVINLLKAIADYVPYKCQDKFYASVYRIYPTVERAQHPGIVETYGVDLYKDHIMMSLPFPKSAMEINAFAKHIQVSAAMACAPPIGVVD